VVRCVRRLGRVEGCVCEVKRMEWNGMGWEDRKRMQQRVQVVNRGGRAVIGPGKSVTIVDTIGRQGWRSSAQEDPSRAMDAKTVLKGGHVDLCFMDAWIMDSKEVVA